MDYIGLLLELGFCDICILPEVKFLELLVLSFSIRPHHVCDEELLQRHSVVLEIRNQQRL